MVQEMDHGIGQIVETIDRLDLTNDTFIFFFSDNGANQHGSNGNLRGRKGTLWEGGHRVPAIAYWPGKIAPEQVCNETAISLDIFPTLLGIENATAPVGLALDGVDLAPVLFEDRPLAPRTLFWEHNQQQAVREGSWKLVVIRKQEETDIALSNLSEDPGETKNLKDIHPERGANAREETRRMAGGCYTRSVGIMALNVDEAEPESGDFPRASQLFHFG